MGSLSVDRSKLDLRTIDFSQWTSPSSSPADRMVMAKDLVQACHETGFVYITNHGIPPELLNKAFALSKSFYALPQDQKLQAGHSEGSTAFRGYSWPGLEKASYTYPGAENVDDGVAGEGIDLTESYGIGSDGAATDPNVWLPDPLLPGFRALTTALYWACWELAQQVLRALSLGLDLPSEDYLLRFHSGHENELSLRHYPPVAESVFRTQKMKRLSAHTDFDSFTLLFQDDCGGLEVQRAGTPGAFVSADALEGALVLNIGDVLMRWSNDYLTSTIHRVTLPPLQDRYTGTGSERTTRGRYSIPYFVSPDHDAVMECLPGCYGEENPPKYQPVLYEEYYRVRVSEIFGEGEG